MVSFLPSPRRAPYRPVRWLHQLSDLLDLAALAARPERGGMSVADRRLQQRLAVGRRLLDPLPAGLRNPELSPECFWRVLRWGSLGLLLALLLRP